MLYRRIQQYTLCLCAYYNERNITDSINALVYPTISNLPTTQEKNNPEISRK